MDTDKPVQITTAELGRHNSRDDCWIAVHSSVWDLTELLDEHPGGPEVLLQVAGQDGTETFDQIHAPGLIEENLSLDKYKGKLFAEATATTPDRVVKKPTAQDARQPEPAAHEELPQELPGSSNNSNRANSNSSSSSSSSIAMANSKTQPEENGATQGNKPPLHTLLSVADFVQVASRALTPKTWAFYSSAATDLVTHQQNRALLRRIMVQPRVLRDVAQADFRRTILGCPADAPFFVSPAAMARLAHPDGELAMARATGREGIIQCISSNASYTLSQIVQAGRPGQPFFFQLYVNSNRAKTADILQKARDLGIKAIFLTVDAPVPGKREADERLAAGQGATSAISGATAKDDKKGGGLGRLMGQYIDKSLAWADLAWIREVSGGLPIVLKGIQTVEDAKLAAEHGVDAIFLSNHGGRSLDTSQPAILNLLELRLRCPEIFSKMEVYVDGGFERGLDILKALALGATAVGLGRPFMYSVLYGQEGTEHMIQILKDEIDVSMRLLGVTSLDQLTPEVLNTSVLEPMLRDLSKFRPIPPRTAVAKL